MIRSRRPLVLGAAGLVAGCSLAGCGGGSTSPGVPSAANTTPVASTPAPAASTPAASASASTPPTSTSSGSGASQLVAFSHCMRTNGVPSFPDPQSYAGGNVKLTIHGLSQTPQLAAALNACSHLLPSRGAAPPSAAQIRTQIADGLSFARCMRSHGVARFPDPTAQGQLSVEMVEAQGIDVHSPSVLQAVAACLPASHGGLTAAKVREALAQAGG